MGCLRITQPIKGADRLAKKLALRGTNWPVWCHNVPLLRSFSVPAAKKLKHFKKVLENRIVEAEQLVRAVERERRAMSTKHADSGDEAAAEFERQNLTFKATAARQVIANLTQALDRIRQGTFGECMQCGNEIEPKRLEAIPWARYCLKCQELREHH